MEVELFCLCEGASLSREGMLTIRGVYDYLKCAELPFRFEEPIAMAFRIRFDRTEQSWHRLIVEDASAAVRGQGRATRR